MSFILGVSAYYHDSAAAVLSDGEIVAAAQEERFTRKKHDAGFPVQAIRYCLQEARIDIDGLDAVVFYDKPFLKFERLLETYYAFAPRGVGQFIKSIPGWLREKLFLKKLLREGFLKTGSYDAEKLNLLFCEHHLSHAASAFYPSPCKEAAILTVDGVGEWATATIGHGKDNRITILKEMCFPHSVGLLYSAFTSYLGFRVNSGEYKLMGLAPYGNPNSFRTKEYIRLIKEHLVSVKYDGSIRVNQDYFNYAFGLKMADERKWEKLFGFPPSDADSASFTQEQCDLAYAIQEVTGDIVVRMALTAKRLTGAECLCMAGGVALNCVVNGRLARENIFRDIFIQPASGDAGGALGSALAAHHMYYEKKRFQAPGMDSMKGAFLGPSFSSEEASRVFEKYGAVYRRIESLENLCRETASAIASGKIVGWFQGRMEFGPRALGNRSILADPRNRDMQRKLNMKTKQRESFRPFAPSVLDECAGEYFNLDIPSPYMLLTAEVREERRKKLPDNYSDMGLWEKLYCDRSDIQPCTHIDFSARIQTVSEDVNPKYRQLIKAFREITGYGLVVNTSFNVRGEPIVCTPDDAYRCFMRTEMDCLVINDFFLRKTEQPEYTKKDKWIEEFDPD